MGSPAPALTPTSCCVTLPPPSSSPPSLSEPESGEMRATEPRSPTPTVPPRGLRSSRHLLLCPVLRCRHWPRPDHHHHPPPRPPRSLPPLPHLRDPHLRQEEERGHRGCRRDQHGGENDGHVPGHYRIRGVHGESGL